MPRCCCMGWPSWYWPRRCSTSRSSGPPLVAVALEELAGALGAVGAGRVGLRLAMVALPAAQDRIDPAPGRLDLVAAHEQRRVTLDHVQQQALVGLPATVRMEGLGQVQIQFHRL